MYSRLAMYLRLARSHMGHDLKGLFLSQVLRLGGCAARC